MYAPRPRSRSLDGYNTYSTPSNRFASFDDSSIPHYTSKRSRRHSSARRPLQHDLPMLPSSTLDVPFIPYTAAPEMLDAQGIRRWGFRRHRMGSSKQMAPHPAMQGWAMNTAHLGVPSHIAPQMGVQGMAEDPRWTAPMNGGMVRFQLGGGEAPDRRLHNPVVDAEDAMRMMRAGSRPHRETRKSKHVHLKENVLAPFADLLRRRGQRARGNETIPVPDYKFVKALKPGGMSHAVNLVKEKSSGKLRVEKRIKITGHPGLLKRAYAELAALKRIEPGRNLNYMIEYLFHGELCSFILEYCDQGSLDSMLEEHLREQRHFKTELVWHILVGVAKALAFLHHGIRDATKDKKVEGWNSICHLDLKPQNIFLSSTGQEGPWPRVVLGDFGCAISRSDIEMGRENPHLQECGTPEWYPQEGRPEMVGIDHTRYGPQTDIWQLGATIHAMCRLIMSPDPSIYTFTNQWSACGRRYGDRLNGAVIWACFPDWRKRPSAATLVKEVAKIAKTKGLGHLVTQRG